TPQSYWAQFQPRCRHNCDGALDQEVRMIVRRFFCASIVAAVLALAAPTFAQKPDNAPKGATAQCNDSTFSTAKTERGACSQHGGVKTWFGAATPPSSTPAPKATAPAPPSQPKTVPPTNTKAPTTAAASAPEGATAKCKDGTYSFAKQHRGACSRH